jgi:hypothetical protein
MTRTNPSDGPSIELRESDGEVTLLIDEGQAMQGWEEALMHESADLLCRHGSEFLEVGLGLGLSALRIAGNPSTRRHTLFEKHAEVIDLFRTRHPVVPETLSIVQADFFNVVSKLPPAAFDGIFFDPYLPMSVRTDRALWDEIMPFVVGSLRPGAVFLPCFTTRPVLYWIDYFTRVVVHRRQFTAYESTSYTEGTTGDAYIQCYYVQ